MGEEWRYQLRVYLDDEMAELARRDPRAPVLRGLTSVLEKHDTMLVNQLQAFEDYVSEAEKAGAVTEPLYRWTKATVADPAMRAKHGTVFSLHAGGHEIYDKAAADALENDLRPLVGGPVVRRMSRHDSNPANNLPVPAEYR